jgi:hypothetical protein
MAALVGEDSGALESLCEDALLEKVERVYSLTDKGAERFLGEAKEAFLPCRPGRFCLGVDRRREANRSLLQLLLDKRHLQRWGVKEYCKPFRFEAPDVKGEELFTVEEGKIAWRYPESPVFVQMARDFPVVGLTAREKPAPTPESLATWMAANAPRRRTVEVDLLYKSRYDFQAYAHFSSLPCDPGGLLNTDRFLCRFASPSGPLSELLTLLGEFHMFLTMMRRMYMPGYVDLDSLDQDAINWLLYVYEREEEALRCRDRLAPFAQSLAGPGAPLEVWSLSLEALWRREGTVESIHDLLPCVAHPITRVPCGHATLHWERG